MVNPLISVIIPVFNVENYIVDCLKSVLAQDYTNLEIIIINDKSTDNSMNNASKCINLLNERYTLKIIEHQCNKGLSAARNSGIKASTGDYLFFLDSDDELYSNTFSSFVNIINTEGDYDMIIGKYMSSTEYQFINPKPQKTNNEVLQSFLKYEWYEMAWNKLINTDFIKKNNISFYECIFHEDTLFSFYLALFAESLTYNNTITYKYRKRKNSISYNILNKNIEDQLFMCEYIISIFNKPNLSDLFYSYIVHQCYHIFKTIAYVNKGNYIVQLRRILNSNYLKKNKISLNNSLKKKLIFLPFFLSRYMFLIFKILKQNK